MINKMPRDRRDFFNKKAKDEGYRSRAAFKLKQINDKFKIIKKGDTVVDLGAAPGGWLQVAKELSGGIVVGVDILDIEEIIGVDVIKGDIRLDKTIEKIKEKIKSDKADVVICDAAPNLSGSWNYDHARSIDPVSYTHLRAHETRHDLVCRLLLEKKKKKKYIK